METVSLADPSSESPIRAGRVTFSTEQCRRGRVHRMCRGFRPGRRRHLVRVFSMAVLVAVVLACAAQARAGGMTADEIMNRANLATYHQGDDCRAKVKMTITDGRGRTRIREFIILRRDEGASADQKLYTYFERPADVRRMVYMVWKHTSRVDDRWLYLSALDLVRRIAATDGRSSFTGSHFFYEDISGRGTGEDTHELVGTTQTQYILKNVPKEADAVEFSSCTLWIDKKTFLHRRAEYLDKGNRKYRVVEALEVENIQGLPTVTRTRVQDVNSGGHTVCEFSGVRYNIGLPESIFTERYLRRAPARYLR